MDTTEQVAAALKALDTLAWPAVTLVALFVLKKPLGELLGRVASLKYGDVEARFEERIDAVKSDAENLQLEGAAGDSEQRVVLYELADHSPRAAVLTAFAEMEIAARDLHRVAGLSDEDRRSRTQPLGTARVFRDLHLHGHLPDGEFRMTQELRLMRNELAHAVDSEVRVVDAQAFVQFSEAISLHLERQKARITDERSGA